VTPDEALVLLHEGTPRQGPGDDRFSLDLLRRLPPLPGDAAIADLGCGTGAAAILLARHLDRPVLCVDTSESALRTLRSRAAAQGVAHLVTTLCADMGTLDPAEHRVDLVWSEGAAYVLTFEGAMRAWRPLLRVGGLAVVSELSWFGTDPPDELREHWAAEYPSMASEEVDVARAERHGFEALFTERLPADAWWANYYDPLRANLEAHARSDSPAVRQAIDTSRREMELFRAFSDHYGYTFYALRAV
jgi:SAM-dependent methyltransferase